MDILIKGLEMPEIGKITLDIYPNGDAFEKRGSERIGYAKATELPPHGRLIDADRLEERSYLVKGVDGRIRTVIELCGIEDAQTILEATE